MLIDTESIIGVPVSSDKTKVAYPGIDTKCYTQSDNWSYVVTMR